VNRYCFITGFLRSGTTLVEKLVHALPGACIGPQPFPFLYHDAKRAFLRGRGIDGERYPLGHLFGEDRYRPGDFEAFLARHRVTREDLKASFAAMRNYSGWKLPAMASHAGRVGEGSLVEVYRALCDGLPGLLGREGSDLLGAKEVFCEEFAPYFLAREVSVVLVLRDVRDVIASLKFGRGTAYGDRGLPLLHIVRQWRKSVAFALALSGARGFHLVRYEALVASARTELDRLARHLGCAPAAAGAIDDLRDQDGRAWEGNSSFAPVRGVSASPVGRYADKLPGSWVAAVESLCGAEMAVLELAPSSGFRSREADVAQTMERAARESDLAGAGASLEAEIVAERRRASLLESGRADEAEQSRWFIFPRAYRRLARSGAVPL